jgi:EAL domain-containing protein (putative c-di-GMP-specific phosphodiesterase class I)/GGDEF domain-containing protein
MAFDMSLFGGFAGLARPRGDRADVAAVGSAQLIVTIQDRAGLEDQVLDLAAHGDRRPLFVAAFGLDRCDRIRAVAGHGAVTQIIRSLAERLRLLEPDWRIGRISDDVLAAAFQAADGEEAERQAEAVRRALQGVHRVGASQIEVRLSAGLSAAGPPAALLREADLALDGARAARTAFCVFDHAAHAAAVGALSLMPELRLAIDEDRLFLAHQPKFDLRTGRVCGVESLVRWTHPRHGPIQPDVFVRIAEESGDIRAMTRWVLEQALDEQASLAAAGFAVPFAVNLSGCLVGDDSFIAWILENKPDRAADLRLEITETAVIDRPEQAFANVARLAAAGAPCSIDDYGAGLSSLAYLKRIWADELKLDKSLIDEVGRSARDAVITRSIVDLAHGLGMKVVAEGVEDAQTAALVAGLGCDVGQGFFFARPMSLAQLIELMRAEAAATQPAQEVTRPSTEAAA